MSGNAGKGALIGAGAGALGGYVYDQQQREREQYRYGDRYPYRDREYRAGRDPDRYQTSQRGGW
jgi:hypothetical protein